MKIQAILSVAQHVTTVMFSQLEISHMLNGFSSQKLTHMLQTPQDHLWQQKGIALDKSGGNGLSCDDATKLQNFASRKMRNEWEGVENNC